MKKGLLVLAGFLMILSSLFFSVGSAKAVDVAGLDQWSVPTGEAHWNYVEGHDLNCQQFKPTHAVLKNFLYAALRDAAGANITATLRPNSNTSNILQTFHNTDDATFLPGWTRFEQATGQETTVVPGNYYWICLTTANMSARWLISDPGNYNSGYLMTDYQGPGTGTFSFDTDYGFAIYTRDPDAEPADNGSPADLSGGSPGTGTNAEPVGGTPVASIAKATSVSASFVDESGSKGVKVTWKASDTADIDGYKVYRTETKGSNYNTVGAVDKNTLSYLDKTVSGGKTYYYTVRAYKGTDMSDQSNEASVTTPASLGPATPSRLHLVLLTDTSIKIGWEKNTETNLAGYTAAIFLGDKQIESADLAKDANDYTFKNLTSGTEYNVKITAKDTTGKASDPATMGQKTKSNPDIVANKFQMTTLTWVLSGVVVALIGTLVLLIARRKRLAKKMAPVA